MIDLHDLRVVYPDGTVGLDEITLRIAPEEFIVLVGPSGSGKTTLLRTIAGFLQAESGALRIGGEDVAGVEPEKRRLGMVFQQHAVWPHMSVADNVAYPLKRAKVGRADIRRRVGDALDLVGLSGYDARRPDRLSGGQRQRVALARAIVANPRVLLLDEALSALDEPLRDSLRRELVSLTAVQRLTTVHVTHDRAEALAIADRIVVLSEGRIRQVATPEELLRAPATAQVASFIADAGVVAGVVQDGRVAAPTLSMSWALPEVELVGPAGGVVDIAVLPSAVEIVPPGTPGSAEGTITSVLFDRGFFSITVSLGEHSFRANLAGQRPQIGENVGVIIRRPLVYGRQ
ncbi:ABC transporter ATP-binding protein [Corynebacterium guangdongense]|uniref:Iron(III) transport system ATP-binding protein n=1 Tax=Corynebacterium guangdongense TaxID=1783348 RepID=A0ABU1ZY59_9CORY|nr:ABC transporter ATP-binding protein [Corynebacterium guangdongense]MDR7329865.1 iron(III) transport system ATP-binding protein [Corynebacterium guangdongense]WJZ18428.1 Sulfate/thiosulfate import ATP-binding protein CysA [Corynebacterium guangdongense]